MDVKGIRPRFGLFGCISAYFCSWCKLLLVSGKGISRKKWSSFVQMFRFHVFGVFMEVIYEMLEGRNFYHQAEAKRFLDHPNTDSGRHQPAALTSRTKKHPWSFNMVHLKIRPWNRRFLTWKPIIFRWIMLNVTAGHGFAHNFFLHSGSWGWSWGWYVWYIKRCSVSTPGSWRLCVTRLSQPTWRLSMAKLDSKGSVCQE